MTRELGVRRRCYRRWVQEGKLTDVDATDRMERLERVLEIVERAILLEELNASQPAQPPLGKPVMVEELNASQPAQPPPGPAQPPLGKTVRVEGFNKDTIAFTSIRKPCESEDDWC